MDRKRHCVGDCNFVGYYLGQTGRGFEDINVFRGHPYQRGHGIGSLFARFGIPLAKFIGKHLLKTGMAVGADALSNNLSKETLKGSLKAGVKAAATEGLGKLQEKINQSGSGRKKAYKRKKIKRKQSKKKPRKRQKRDLFS